MSSSSQHHIRRASTWSEEELNSIYDLENETLGGKTRRLLQVLKAIRHCNKAANLEDSLRVVTRTTCEILECESASLFLIDEKNEQLVIRSLRGHLPDTRLPLDGQSIAGIAYETGTRINITDVQNDPRFNKMVDQVNGHIPKSMLCIPILDGNYDPVAILEAVNKIQGSGFTAEDELLMDHLSLQIGVALRNQLLLDETKRARNQLESLLNIVQSLHSDLGIFSLLFTITERSPSLVGAERCLVYLIDKKKKELWCRQGSDEIRVPLGTGLVGYVANSGEALNIESPTSDKRFNPSVDAQRGHPIKNALIMPICDKNSSGKKPQVVGVLHLINKIHEPKFTVQDEAMLYSFLDIVGSLLVNSQLFYSRTEIVSEFGAAQDLDVTTLQSPRIAKPKFMGTNVIAEATEEEENDVE